MALESKTEYLRNYMIKQAWNYSIYQIVWWISLSDTNPPKSKHPLKWKRLIITSITNHDHGNGSPGVLTNENTHQFSSNYHYQLYNPTKYLVPKQMKLNSISRQTNIHMCVWIEIKIWPWIRWESRRDEWHQVVWYRRWIQFTSPKTSCSSGIGFCIYFYYK